MPDPMTNEKPRNSTPAKIIYSSSFYHPPVVISKKEKP
jgi:hypothetical protein